MSLLTAAMPRKPVTFKLDADISGLLGQIATQYDHNFPTRSDLVQHAIECLVHQLAAEDEWARLTIRRDIDRRASHECFGGRCIACKHLTACKAGDYLDGYESRWP